ncbi:peptidoglycan DD-metalloendopeptidase family protein [Yoonia vestfoldensis]|uniref:Peptidoglycan-binding LysM (Possible peptidase) n=1 Tax=Yoonia vestfoldensis SKA53 TaxID=314232 RepID=A3V433_9RHOB|nr:M23 family metallopeptidase [Yoonia vestfoldensis]EAQ07240.1 Peptidoglycan-binding LysM (possible peptidase) [Yoonia vestfoldensis SKA53]
MAQGQSTIRTLLLTSVALAALAACEGFDPDMRDLGNGFSTASAVQDLPKRPRPDDRGVISYPTYQVVVAQQDDTIRGIAIRLGLDANTLAQYNGIEPDTILRRDEIVALPSRLPDGAIAPDAPVAQQPFDVAAVATSALDRADAEGGQITATALPPADQAAPPAAVAPATAAIGAEPIRHQVVRGETAFSISRLYNVPVTAIAEWNGLNSEFTIREGQYLLIPQGGATPQRAPAAVVTAPGAGSETPVPPSAARPLPAATAPVAAPQTPDTGTPAPAPAPAAASASRLAAPVQGSIIRAYAPGTNEGVDFGVPAGTDVRAADAGSVAAVTTDTSGGSIVVIRHADGLLTVYTQMDNLTVQKDASISRGQVIGKVRAGNPSFLHFEVRRGLQSVDPMDFLP